MDTPYETMLSPDTLAGYWVAFEDGDGNWVAAPAENAARMGARPGQAVTVLAEPDPWPTDDLILIRDGECADVGTIRDRVAFRVDAATNEYMYVDSTGRGRALNHGCDQITDYLPLTAVPADVLDTLLGVDDGGEHVLSITSLWEVLRRIREFKVAAYQTATTEEEN